MDSKQLAQKQTIEVGSTKLSEGVGEAIQLSPNWNQKVVEKVGDKKLENLIVETGKVGKLKTAVVGVNKENKKLILIPVNVPNKTAQKIGKP